jgi:UDP-glucose 4-epimerase
VKVLVTGGAGFIGRAVEAALGRADHEAVILDVHEEGDIRDRDAVDRAVDGCDAVIHLAGVLGTHELFDDVSTAIDINIKGTVNVLDACLKHEARYVGITMPQVFPSIYTATKIAATKMATAYHETYRLPVSHVRAFNAYGIGQKHGPGHPQKIVPTFAFEAWAGRPIPIWGSGSQTVDLIHVDDLGRMLVDAIDYGNDDVFDGGTGVAVTVNEVAKIALRVTGSKADVEHLPMRRGEKPTHIVAEGRRVDHARVDARVPQGMARADHRGVPPDQEAGGVMEDVCVISSVYGGYDTPCQLPAQDRPHDAILVTDIDYTVPGWTTLVEPREHMHPRMAAKVAKCRPDIYTDAKITIWVDASMQVTRADFVSWCVQQIGVHLIAQIRHPERQRITDEADVSSHMLKYQGQEVVEQARHYLAGGFPDGWGMWATGLIVRRTTAQTKLFGAEWLQQQVRWTYQDQISEPPTLAAMSLQPVDLETELWQSPFFSIRAHASDR